VLKLSTILVHMNACGDAKIWAKTQPDLQTAWQNCQIKYWQQPGQQPRQHNPISSAVISPNVPKYNPKSS